MNRKELESLFKENKMLEYMYNLYSRKDRMWWYEKTN